MNTDDVVYTRSYRMDLKHILENKAMSIEKTGILLLSMTVLVTVGFVSNQAFAGITCDEGYIYDGNNACIKIPQPVGGLAVPVSESQLFGELATQYSLWLIPTLSAVGIGAYIIKRKI